jgi:hypothetical protein
MKRREFIKSTSLATTSAILSPMSCTSSDKNQILYSKLPRWRGFNLQEKFTHKPDEWLNIAPEWGMSNDPFRESDFEMIA